MLAEGGQKSTNYLSLQCLFGRERLLSTYQFRRQRQAVSSPVEAAEFTLPTPKASRYCGSPNISLSFCVQRFHTVQLCAWDACWLVESLDRLLNN